MNSLHEAHEGIKDALSAPRTVVMAVANVAFLGISLAIGDYIEKNVLVDHEALEAAISAMAIELSNQGGQGDQA